MMTPRSLEQTLALAVQAASAFEGRTAPNPPVGAIALGHQNQILAQDAHVQAGLPHAEAVVLSRLEQEGRLSQLKTLIVTLEPCNHQGRTPACTSAILRAQERSPFEVVYGESDPNPEAGGGAAALSAQGVAIRQLSTPETRALLAPFKKRVTQGLPWITLKTALRETAPGQWTHLPPPGQKTFTQSASIRLAHELRKRSDAILTGSGTWLTDQPLFTIREVPDHLWDPRHPKRRLLWIFDRRGQVPEADLLLAQERGFEVFRDVGDNLLKSLELVAQKGVLRALVEAGPILTTAFQNSGLWDEHVVVRQPLSGKDAVEILRRRPSE